MRGGVLSLVVVLGVVAGCERTPAGSTSSQPAVGEVIVYTALDRQFSEPILNDFTARTGIVVRPAYDSEATKTVGLTNRIRAAATRPRCDVFWNNEILNTLRLRHEGLLQPCAPAEAANYPPQFRDPDGYWFGFAARARVLIVNTELVPAERMPTSIADLADPQWKGRTGIAKPLFGTTASHVACLFALHGKARATALLDSLRNNDVQVLSGNKGCAEMVGAGRLVMALTDTDDAIVELETGKPVKIVFPDGGADQMGRLLLPNTLALVKGCPNPEAGAQLINYLLSAEVEGRLAAGPSAQIPLHRAATVPSRVGRLEALRTMPVDLTQAADAFDAAAMYIEQRFLAP
jgi:iron(III) transport system substrate-binding protein